MVLWAVESADPLTYTFIPREEITHAHIVHLDVDDGDFSPRRWVQGLDEHVVVRIDAIKQHGPALLPIGFDHSSLLEIGPYQSDDL